MGCSTQNQQATQFTVTFGALPEGFCGSMQELGQAIADRLIIQIANNLSSFVTGSIAPSSNVGPWLKDCIRWYVWDDETSTYIPEGQSGFTTMQYITTAGGGNFIVPDGVYKLRAHCWGGGAGGSDASGVSSGGGGGGGYGRGIFNVVPNQVIAYSVGAAGTSGNPATDGGNTTFLTMTANGGEHSIPGGEPGTGGTVTGATFSISGGGGDYGIAAKGGTGGDSPQGGQGGKSSTTNDPLIQKGTQPGGGGVGGCASGHNSAGGADGAILIEY